VNLAPLLQQLSIQDTSGAIVPLNLNWAQKEYVEVVESKLHAGKPVRLIVLKARQLGISTVTEALMFTMAFANDRFRGLVIAHEMESSQHLLGMCELFWDTYPYARLFTPKYASKNEKAWQETGSAIKVATAENARAGRSRTLAFLHASEVAFWRYPKETMLGMRQAVHEKPGTFIVIESTANGVGNWFYNEWQAAENGDTDYIPLFFPWHRHPEYTASYIDIPYDALGRLDSDERALRAMGLSDDRLAWRRWAIRNKAGGDLLKFNQEYPTTPDEAFISTGTNVFPVGHLRECYQPLVGKRGRLIRSGRDQAEFVRDPTGALTIYKDPARDREWGVYILGADPTKTTRGDYACIQVLSRRTMEQVATYRLKIDAGSFAKEVALLGRFYNEGLIVPETTGPGSTTLGGLLAINYPYIFRRHTINRTPGRDEMPDTWGWDTSRASKDLAVGWLIRMVVEHGIVIHDRNTFTEMKDYVTMENGEYGPASTEGHDDTVMALAIANGAHHLEPPLMPYTGQTERIDVEALMGGHDPSGYVSWEDQMGDL
jgi:hypothetical protein